MPKQWLPIPYHKQQNDSDCLAACAAMILSYLGHPIVYQDLLYLLKIRAFGAPASNIRFLETRNLQVSYSVTDINGLESFLDQGLPVIVFLQAGELPHWHYRTDHACVVVGCDEANIYMNDPAFEQPAIAVPRGDFELAWLEREYYYALIETPEK